MTGTLNNSLPARDIGYGVVQCIVKTISFDTPSIGTSDLVKVGTIPAGSQILQASVRRTAAFNAATTNVLIVGTAAGSDADIVAGGDVDETVVGTTLVYRGADLAFAVDTTIYAKYTQSGTAATTGSAVIVIIYVAVNNG